MEGHDPGKTRDGTIWLRLPTGAKDVHRDQRDLPGGNLSAENDVGGVLGRAMFADAETERCNSNPSISDI
jgi:hypothetical protein